MWVDLKDIMLRGKSQFQKAAYSMISFYKIFEMSKL